MVKDNEWAGIGNFMDFGERGEDTRVARFLSLDPMARKFAGESNYIFAGNSPIIYVDAKGEFKFSKQTLDLLLTRYPTAYMYLVQTDPTSSGNVLEVVQDERIINILIQNTMNANPDRDKSKDKAEYSQSKYKLTKEKLQNAFKAGGGPEIQITMSPGGYGAGDPMFEEVAGGYNKNDDGTDYSTPIELNERMFQRLENASNDLARKMALTNIVSTLINEYMEDFGADEVDIVDQNGAPTGKTFGNNVAQKEIFGGYRPAIGTADAHNMIKAEEDGNLKDPTFIPNVPVNFPKKLADLELSFFRFYSL